MTPNLQSKDKNDTDINSNTKNKFVTIIIIKLMRKTTFENQIKSHTNQIKII